MASNTQINAAFKLAGFSKGVPSETNKRPFLVPNNDDTLAEIFTDDFIRKIQEKAGENPTTIADRTEANQAGWMEAMAASIIETTISAGYTTEGRPIDLEGVNSAGVVSNYSTGPELHQIMRRRVADLRAQARKKGADLLPSGALSSGLLPNGAGINAVISDNTLTGDGTTSNPLSVAPVRVLSDGSITGSGTPGDPLSVVGSSSSSGFVSIASDDTLTGTGQPDNPLSVASTPGVITDDTLEGDGTAGDPLTVVGGGAAGLQGPPGPPGPAGDTIPENLELEYELDEPSNIDNSRFTLIEEVLVEGRAPNIVDNVFTFDKVPPIDTEEFGGPKNWEWLGSVQSVNGLYTINRIVISAGFVQQILVYGPNLGQSMSSRPPTVQAIFIYDLFFRAPNEPTLAVDWSSYNPLLSPSGSGISEGIVSFSFNERRLEFRRTPQATSDLFIPLPPAQSFTIWDEYYDAAETAQLKARINLKFFDDSFFFGHVETTEYQKKSLELKGSSIENEPLEKQYDNPEVTDLSNLRIPIVKREQFMGDPYMRFTRLWRADGVGPQNDILAPILINTKVYTSADELDTLYTVRLIQYNPTVGSRQYSIRLWITNWVNVRAIWYRNTRFPLGTRDQEPVEVPRVDGEGNTGVDLYTTFWSNADPSGLPAGYERFNVEYTDGHFFFDREIVNEYQRVHIPTPEISTQLTLKDQYNREEPADPENTKIRTIERIEGPVREDIIAAFSGGRVTGLYEAGGPPAIGIPIPYTSPDDERIRIDKINITLGGRIEIWDRGQDFQFRRAPYTAIYLDGFRYEKIQVTVQLPYGNVSGFTLYIATLQEGNRYDVEPYFNTGGLPASALKRDFNIELENGRFLFEGTGFRYNNKTNSLKNPFIYENESKIGATTTRLEHLEDVIGNVAFTIGSPFADAPTTTNFTNPDGWGIDYSATLTASEYVTNVARISQISNQLLLLRTPRGYPATAARIHRTNTLTGASEGFYPQPGQSWRQVRRSSHYDFYVIQVDSPQADARFVLPAGSYVLQLAPITRNVSRIPPVPTQPTRGQIIAQSATGENYELIPAPTSGAPGPAGADGVNGIGFTWTQLGLYKPDSTHVYPNGRNYGQVPTGTEWILVQNDFTGETHQYRWDRLSNSPRTVALWRTSAASGGTIGSVGAEHYIWKASNSDLLVGRATTGEPDTGAIRVFTSTGNAEPFGLGWTEIGTGGGWIVNGTASASLVTVPEGTRWINFVYDTGASQAVFLPTPSTFNTEKRLRFWFGANHQDYVYNHNNDGGIVITKASSQVRNAVFRIFWSR